MSSAKKLGGPIAEERSQDVAIEVQLWHGELDLNAPAAMGHYAAAAIPKCQARFYEDEAHASLLAIHQEEILGALSSPAEPGRSAP